jgi:hypothetical protein
MKHLWLMLIVLLLVSMSIGLYVHYKKTAPLAEVLTQAEIQKRDAKLIASTGPNVQPGPGPWAAAFNYDRLSYDRELIVPQSGVLSLKFDDLYPGERTRGGCSWKDETYPGSYMPLLEHDTKHEVVKAPVGHKIARHCEWITPREEVKK